MNKIMFLKPALIFSLVCAFLSNINAQTINPDFLDGTIYVKLEDTSSLELSPYDQSNAALNLIFNTYGVDTIEKPFPGLNLQLDKTYRILFQEAALIDDFILELQGLAFVDYAEKAPLYRVELVPNDIDPAQWALAKINAIQAWDLSTGSSDVTIAIVDNAVSTTHEDLSAKIWVNPGEIPGNFIDDDLNGFADDVNGWDAADFDNNPNPPITASPGSPFSHGTHCSGIAAASTNNGIGIASLGYNTTIIPVKCSKDLAADEGATLSNSYDGVYYAIKAGADIISMSWGGSSGSFVTGENIINAANAFGIVLIAASGNDNTTTLFYPAAYNNVISVGSTNNADQKSWFSNYGSSIDVMAPGSSIYSCISDNNSAYETKSGTSMACPLVAGLAGLILEMNPALSTQEVEQIIEDGCENIDLLNSGYVGQIGAGRINAYNSLLLVLGVEELDQNDFKVYPNPFENEISFEATSNYPYEIRVYSFLGNLIHREMFFSKSAHLNSTLWTKGIFFVEIEQDGKVYRSKLVKE